MSCSERTPRDRPKPNGLALLAALILVALLTGCSSGQPVRGFTGWSAIEVQGAEHYALDTTHETSEPTAQPTEDGTNTGIGNNAALSDNVISGHAYDAAGGPLAGVNIYIQVVPESGEVYQTMTDTSGAYSYSVPEGAYLILAEFGGTSLVPVDGDSSVSVPTTRQVDFQLSS
jgi:hypothetical protein